MAKHVGEFKKKILDFEYKNVKCLCDLFLRYSSPPKRGQYLLPPKEHKIDCPMKSTNVGTVFRSLADTWADTTMPHNKLMLAVLAPLAEFERSLIRLRVESGIREARERGVQFGRPPTLN